jgi:5,10-methenyltetrahydrofolate synthetase/tRNA threonylcarbamoyl adenosine modification protein YjeE
MLTFVGLPGEPDTRPLLDAILADGRTLILPRVEGRDLRLYCVHNPETQLRPSPPYGIFEPVPARCEAWEGKPIDLALVPGLAFDIEGNRLGHGEGFFDRALCALRPKPTTFGLAFEFQVRRSIPHDSHDVPVDGIITEDRFFRYRSSRLMTYSPEETRRLGERLAKAIPSDSILALTGPLGCGKTVLVQGLARGLSIHEEVVSQTFTLVKEHRSPEGTLWHVDLYRLRSAQEIELGFWFEILGATGIKAIEWSDRLGDQLPLEAIMAQAAIYGETEREWTIATPLDDQSGVHEVGLCWS